MKIARTTFEEFWQRYPRKVGKLAAERKWNALKPTPEVIAQMFAALTWQCTTWTDPQFIPYPATWLFQGRWLDERPGNGNGHVPGNGRAEPTWLENYCFHSPTCTDSDLCRAKRATDKGGS